LTVGSRTTNTGSFLTSAMTEHTFIVLAYGDSPYLADCLASLKQQTVRSRILLATSTPSDHIRNIAGVHGVEVRVTADGQGIAHDWNFGLVQALTPYVTLAHQDDIYLPDYTRRCLQSAARHEDALIVFPDYAEIANGLVRKKNLLLWVKQVMLRLGFIWRESLGTVHQKKRLIAFGSPIPAPGVMYNIHRLGGFRFSRHFDSNLDWDAWYRMAGLEGSFIYIRQVLMYHRIHPDSATTGGLKDRIRQSEDLDMFRRFWPEPLARSIAWLYRLSYRSNRVSS